jgi:hypothetical protein
MHAQQTHVRELKFGEIVGSMKKVLTIAQAIKKAKNQLEEKGIAGSVKYRSEAALGLLNKAAPEATLHHREKGMYWLTSDEKLVARLGGANDISGSALQAFGGLDDLEKELGELPKRVKGYRRSKMLISAAQAISSLVAVAGASIAIYLRSRHGVDVGDAYSWSLGFAVGGATSAVMLRIGKPPELHDPVYSVKEVKGLARDLAELKTQVAQAKTALRELAEKCGSQSFQG